MRLLAGEIGHDRGLAVRQHLGVDAGGRAHRRLRTVGANDQRHLQRLAVGHGSRERFLTELTLDPPDATSDQSGVPLLDEDYLILSTLHSAKGQEWNAVSVLNVVDGCIPSDVATRNSAEIEEERRLLYVQPGVGHYGVFNGRRFRDEIYPRVRDFIAQNEAAGGVPQRSAAAA